MGEVSKEFDLVGGKVIVTFYGVDESMADFLVEKIVKEGLRLQKIFNFYDNNSELCILNKRRKIKASKELLELLKICLPYCELTESAYDITRGKNIDERKKGKVLSKTHCSHKNIIIKKDTITLDNPEVIIDLGSAAKGYIGDKLSELIKGFGVEDFFLDLRGDLVSHGDHKETIKIQHPRDKDLFIHQFEITNKSVATSGDYLQYFKTYKKSHIINSKDIISATVISDTLTKADIIATCLIVSGTKGLNNFKEEKYFLVDQHLKTHMSEGFKNETN